MPQANASGVGDLSGMGVFAQHITRLRGQTILTGGTSPPGVYEAIPQGGWYRRWVIIQSGTWSGGCCSRLFVGVWYSRLGGNQNGVCCTLPGTIYGTTAVLLSLLVGAPGDIL